MNKRNTIIYWIATLWLALGMFSTALVQLLRLQSGVEPMVHLGYPVYFASLLGIWKILGVVAVLLPKYPLLKEWAYAGFFFAMSRAAYSRLALGDPLKEILPSLFLLLLTLLSWYYRPAERKLIVKNNK